jgi:hypothetical protein
MTHCQWVEIIVEKRSPFRPHRGLAAPDLFLNTILDQRTWEACPIDYREGLVKIYKNIFQTCHLKGKTYKDAQLWELIHFIAVEYTPEHKVIYRSKPTGEKREEGETAAERQPPRASGREATMSFWRWWLGVAKTRTQRAKAPPTWRVKCRSGFTTLPPAPLLEQPDVVLYWRGLRPAKYRSGFMWFRPPERNTLRPRESVLYCCVCDVQAVSWTCLKES